MADAGTIGASHSDPGRRIDSGWWSAVSPLAHSDPGRRIDSGWWSAASPLSTMPTATVYLVPGWGWWTVPIPMVVTPALLRQLPPAPWWQAGAVSLFQSRRCLGTARLSGTVTVSGAGASRWVMICERRTLEVIAVTQSAADGTWHIDGLDGAAELYVAVALDAALNLAGLDRLTAVAP